MKKIRIRLYWSLMNRYYFPNIRNCLRWGPALAGIRMNLLYEVSANESQRIQDPYVDLFF